jgi:hypothetical protein
MPRPRERVCLQDGLKLDLYRLAPRGFIRLGLKTGPIGIRWYSSYRDEDIASGLITADMNGEQEGWFPLQLGNVAVLNMSSGHPCHKSISLPARANRRAALQAWRFGRALGRYLVGVGERVGMLVGFVTS